MADQDPSFYGTNYSLPFISRVMAVARTLPILENALASEIRYMFHFSENDEISTFSARPILYCWADVLSAELGIIKAITNAPNPANYSSLYILRIGLDPAQELCRSPLVGAWVRGRPGRCIEYGLAQPVSSGNFGQVQLTLDPSGAFFL